MDQVEWLVDVTSDAFSTNHQQACTDSINFPLQPRFSFFAFTSLKKKRQ